MHMSISSSLCPLAGYAKVHTNSTGEIRNTDVPIGDIAAIGFHQMNHRGNVSALNGILPGHIEMQKTRLTTYDTFFLQSACKGQQWQLGFFLQVKMQYSKINQWHQP